MMFKRLGQIAINVGQTLLVLHLVKQEIGWCIQCKGRSMEPTLKSNEWVLVENYSIKSRSVKKGNVVVAVNPHKPQELICKRLMGMEGDKIYTPYISTPVVDFMGPYQVPRGHIWLEGDNASVSSDSREYGSVPYGLLRSRVIYRLWPPGRMGPINEEHFS